MIKVNVSLGIGFVGAKHEDVLEFEDDTSVEEIDEAVKDWAWNYIDLNWYKQGE